MSDLVVRVGSDLKGFNAGKDLDRAFADISKSASGLGAQLDKIVGGSVSKLGGVLEGIAKSAGAPVRALGGLSDAIGSFGFFTQGIRSLGDAAVGLGSALGIGLNAEMEDTRAQFMAFTKDAATTDKILGQIREEASKTPFAFSEMAKAAAGLMPAAKGARVELFDLVKQAEILAASNPAEGLEGAAFALREAVSGDFASVIERFNLPRSYINQLKEEGVPALEIVSRAMQELGIDASLVENRAKTMSGRWSTFLDTIDTIRQRVSARLFEALSGGLQRLQGFLDSNIETINAWADAAGRAIGQVAGIVSDLITTGGDIGVLADNLNEAFGINISGLVGPVRALIATLGTLRDYFGFILEAGDPWNDALADMSDALRLVVQPFGIVISLVTQLRHAATALFAGDLSGAIGTVAHELQQFGSAVGAYLSFALEVVGGWAGDVAAAIGAALPGIVAKLAEWGAALVGWVGPQIPVLVGKLGELVGGIAGWVIQQAPVLARSLLTWANTVAGPWVQEAALQLYARLSTFANNLLVWVGRQVPALLAKFGEWKDAALGWIVPLVQSLPARLGALKDAAWVWIAETAPQLLAKLGEWKDAFLGWALPLIKELPEKLLAVKDAAWAFVKEWAPKLLDQLGQWKDAFLEWVLPVVRSLPDKLGQVKDAVWTWITDTVPKATEKLKEFGAAFVDWVGPVLTNIPKKLEEFRLAVVGWVDGTLIPESRAAFDRYKPVVENGLVKVMRDARDELRPIWDDITRMMIDFEPTGKRIERALEALGLAFDRVLAPAVEKVVTWLQTFQSRTEAQKPFLERLAEHINATTQRWEKFYESVANAVGWLIRLEERLRPIVELLGRISPSGQAAGGLAPLIDRALQPSVGSPSPSGGGVQAWVGGHPILAPQVATGGIVTSSGLAMVHAAEVIGPIESVGRHLGAGAPVIDYDRLARAMERVRLAVSVDDVHGALLRKQRRNVGLGFAGA